MMRSKLFVGLASILISIDAVSAALPVGSVALYSNGKVEKLVSSVGGLQIWEDDRKRRFTRSSNPIVPVLERQDFLSGKGYRQIVSKGDPSGIYTRQLGARVGLDIIRTKYTGEKSMRHWECVRRPNKRKKVLGVRRDLERYVCERFVYGKIWQRKFRERREYSYSPELGLVVDMERETRKGNKRWKLSEILPPAKTSYKRLSRKVRKLRGTK